MERDQGTHGPSGKDGDDENPLSRKEWMGLFGYFIGGLGVASFFVYMMMTGPKGILAGGVSLFVGILVWIVYRYVFKEVD